MIRFRAASPVALEPTARASSFRGARLWRSRWVLLTFGGIVALAAVAWTSGFNLSSPSRLRAEAESAARAGDWQKALQSWRALNGTAAAEGATRLGEARACLALGLAAQAEVSLRQAAAADPADPEPWRLLLEILRVEDRTIEAKRLGWEAHDHVPPGARRAILRELTLALLADLPDELVRTTLGRWIAADARGDDVDARVALLQRIAAQPRAADPDRASRLAALEVLVANHLDHVGAREALATALADAGEPDRGRAVLDGWPGPESDRDARYWRLRGRWELEYDHQPDRATGAFQRALVDLPQDWRTWYRLARALRTLGRDDQAREAAVAVGRIREVLEPMALGPRLDAAFGHLDDPAALRDLAALADHVGLVRLAEAWRAESSMRSR
jgi:tetratricopeptide (TPR) repeat protein